ncbi:MAG: ABC transporter permease subunit [Bacteriovoracaceae bacterium]|nr:ABC transporter permease subunit [Bacteriovoracaceae bacterium]
MRINPLTIKKFKRFKSIKRGYYSLLVFSFLILVSLFGELLVNSRALLVNYNGRLYFPTYGQMISGKVFGLDYDYETNYRDLAKRFKEDKSDNWVLLPMVPYNPFENDLKDDKYPPFPPSFSEKHYLGTDTIGRDIFARIIYGFRIAMGFSFILLLVNYSIGVTLGCLMGFWGGKFDLFFQRMIEIWANVPFLYVIIIIASIVTPNFITLIIIMAMFGWMGMTWQMRTTTYKEKAREYVLAAKTLGASNTRIIFKHIIPNTISIIVTYIPFSVSGGIVALTSLDYLGFGLPAPTPSWGELLQQGWANMNAYWIASSVILAMVITLTTVTFIGEAIREALDPKLHTTYE